jgi:hypothetical protein
VLVSQLTGRKSQAGFKLACVNEKIPLLKRVRARTEVVAVSAHDAL